MQFVWFLLGLFTGSTLGALIMAIIAGSNKNK